MNTPLIRKLDLPSNVVEQEEKRQEWVVAARIIRMTTKTMLQLAKPHFGKSLVENTTGPGQKVYFYFRPGRKGSVLGWSIDVIIKQGKKHLRWTTKIPRNLRRLARDERTRVWIDLVREITAKQGKWKVELDIILKESKIEPYYRQNAKARRGVINKLTEEDFGQIGVSLAQKALECLREAEKLEELSKPKDPTDIIRKVLYLRLRRDKAPPKLVWYYRYALDKGPVPVKEEKDAVLKCAQKAWERFLKKAGIKRTPYIAGIKSLEKRRAEINQNLSGALRLYKRFLKMIEEMNRMDQRFTEVYKEMERLWQKEHEKKTLP